MPLNRTSQSDRWGVLYALRGFALYGILLVNLPDLLVLHVNVAGTSDPKITTVLQYVVQSRFVPIFTALSGASLVFVIRGAQARRRSAAAAALSRLAAPFAIGVLHRFLYPAEILAEYAVVGSLMLPAVLYLPRVGVVLAAAVEPLGRMAPAAVVMVGQSPVSWLCSSGFGTPR